MRKRTTLWHWLILGIFVAWAGRNESVEAGLLVLNVAGDWDGQFQGTIVERSDGGGVGEPQIDSLVFSLRQSGSSVIGEAIFGQGRSDELRLPLSGSVEGNQFTYQAEIQVEDCLLILKAETTLNTSANEFSGDQTQSSCEGKAIGRITATKREEVPGRQ